MKLTPAIILILGLLSGLTPLAIDMYLPSIPTIARAIDVDINLVQMTLSMYLGVFAVVQLLFGPLSDAFGRRKIVVSGLLLFLLGSLMCAFAQDFSLLMAGRAVQAFGGGAVAVAVPALVKDGLSTDQFAKAMSYIMLVMAVAPLIAPILGGAVLVLLNWHYIFIVLAIVTLSALFLFSRYIPETLALEHRSPLSFVKALRTYRDLLGNRAIIGHILAGAFHFTGMMCFITGSSFVYIELYGIDEAWFGFLFGLNIVTMMIATTINGKWIDRVGAQKMTELGIKIVSVSALVMAALCLLERPPLWALVLPIMIFVGAMGILAGGLIAGAMAHAGKSAGSVTALAGMCRFSIGAIGGVIVSVLHNGTFVPMVGTMAAMGVLTFLCYHFIARSETR